MSNNAATPPVDDFFADNTPGAVVRRDELKLATAARVVPNVRVSPAALPERGALGAETAGEGAGEAGKADAADGLAATLGRGTGAASNGERRPINAARSCSAVGKLVGAVAGTFANETRAGPCGTTFAPSSVSRGLNGFKFETNSRTPAEPLSARAGAA